MNDDIPQAVLDTYQRIKDQYHASHYKVTNLTACRDGFVCFSAPADVNLIESPTAYVIDRQGNVTEIPPLSAEWFAIGDELSGVEE